MLHRISAILRTSLCVATVVFGAVLFSQTLPAMGASPTITFVNKGEDGQICTVDADGTNFRILTSFSSSPWWVQQPQYSPDGKLIAFWLTTGAGGAISNVWIMNSDGSNLRQLTFNNDAYNGDRVTFTPNSDMIYYRRTTGPGAASISKIHVNGQGNSAHCDYPGNELGAQLVGNNYLLYYLFGADIYKTTDLSSCSSSRIVPGGQMPAVSKDLARLAYQDYGVTAARITMSNIDGTSPFVLATEASGTWSHNPSFTPDGQYVVYGAQLGSTSNIRIVKTDGTGLRTITQGYWPNVSPGTSGGTSSATLTPASTPICASDTNKTIPITINNGTGAQAIEFDVVYDSAKLKATTATTGTLTGGWSVSSNVTTGRIRVAMASSTSLTSASGEIAKITFQGQSGMTSNSSTSISIENVRVNDLAGTGGSATITCTGCKPGDVNGNGSVTALDASLVLQAVVGAITLDGNQTCAADFNKNGSVTALDASLILQCVVTGTCP